MPSAGLLSTGGDIQEEEEEEEAMEDGDTGITAGTTSTMMVS